MLLTSSYLPLDSAVADSNIIIYAIRPANAKLRQLIAGSDVAVSAVSYVEVLGYHQLSQEDRDDLEELFRLLPMIALSEPVLDKAVALRQQRRMSLGDSLVAACCLVTGRVLWTRNTSDFVHISDLRVYNPMDQT